jgi:hypothetical protein
MDDRELIQAYISWTAVTMVLPAEWNASRYSTAVDPQALPQDSRSPADDLRITSYTAEPDTEDAERLALAVVLGTQALVD